MSAMEWEDDEIDALQDNARCEGVEQGRREERERIIKLVGDALGWIKDGSSDSDNDWDDGWEAGARRAYKDILAALEDSSNG